MNVLSRRGFLYALTLLGVASRGGATTIVPITLDALTQRSEHVILGTVRVTTSRWRGRFIVTDCEVQVDAALRGTLAPGSVVRVRVAGGVVEGVGQMIPDAPMPTRGETAVFFLRDVEDGAHLLTHMTAAVLPVTLDAGGRATVGTAPGLRDPASGTSGQPARAMPVEVFARAVRAAEGA